MSRQIAPQTRSKALRRTKRVLDARQGMEGAKNAYRGSQEVKRADTPNQGLSGRQEPRQPLQSLFAGNRQPRGWWVVVDRRCYSDGGLGFSPDGFRLRSRRCRNRGGSEKISVVVCGLHSHHGHQRWEMDSVLDFTGGNSD